MTSGTPHRCRWITKRGVRYFIPGCIAAANSNGRDCTCPAIEKAPPVSDFTISRAEWNAVVATVDALARDVRTLRAAVDGMKPKE